MVRPTTFFEWVEFLLQQYGSLFLRGTGITLLVAITGTVLGFLLGLLVAVIVSLATKAPGDDVTAIFDKAMKQKYSR